MPEPDRSDPAGEITEELIRRLVEAFYARVRADDQLGPIFARAISGDWAPHLERMCAFWSSVMLTSGRYKGKPMVAHLSLKTIQRQHFDRWLLLFDRTARETCPPATAAAFAGRAERIAESLKAGLFGPLPAETGGAPSRREAP